MFNQLLIARNMHELDVMESVVAEALPDVLATHLAPISALHPAGLQRTGTTNARTPWYQQRQKAARCELPENQARHFRVGDDVEPHSVGNIDEWVHHEGCNRTGGSECLRKKTFEMADEDRRADSIQFANRVLLHQCSSYCLRKFKLKNGGYICECRFHYGLENALVKARTDGKQARKCPALVTRKGLTYFEAERDHPRFVQGCESLARGWGANMALQPVFGLEHSRSAKRHRCAKMDRRVRCIY